MRICYLTREPPGHGGIGTYTDIIARKMEERGHEVTVIEGDPKTYRMPLAATVGRILRTFEVNRALKKLIQNADIVQAPDFYAEGLGVRGYLPLAIRISSPYFTIREKGSRSIDTIMADWMERRAMEHAVGWISPSQALADLIEESWHIHNIHVIPNGIDVERFEPRYDGEGICYLGKVSALKGESTLRDVVAYFKGKERIVFIGTGTERFVGNGVESHGDVKGKERFDIMASAKVVIIPSRWENFPWVALEAMSLGKPVVSYDVGGMGEVITHGKNGLLCGELEEFIWQLENVLNDGGNEMGKRARETVEEHFNANLMAKRTERFYKEIV